MSRRVYERQSSRREDIAFYQSPDWRTLRASILAIRPLSERCEKAGRTVAATMVHHKIERKIRPDHELDATNLESLCTPCHSSHHAHQKRTRV